MSRQQGFTLIEVLVVIAIIGLLLAITFGLLTAARARATVREAAQQISADLNRARSSAQRRNQDSSLTLASDGRTYTLSLAGTTTTSSLPSGITVQRVGVSPDAVVYTAPFGEVNSATGSLWQVTGRAATSYVKIIGVTGKVGIYEN